MSTFITLQILKLPIIQYLLNDNPKFTYFSTDFIAVECKRKQHMEHKHRQNSPPTVHFLLQTVLHPALAFPLRDVNSCNSANHVLKGTLWENSKSATD